MIIEGEHKGDLVQMPLPIDPHELSLYCNFLAKGQYFKKYRKPLQTSAHVITFDVFNKLVFNLIKRNYIHAHGANLFNATLLKIRTPRLSMKESA